MKTLLFFRPLPLARFVPLSAAVVAVGFLSAPAARAQTEATVAPQAAPTGEEDPDAVLATSSLSQAINAHGIAEDSKKPEDYAAAFALMQQAIVDFPQNSLANAWYGYMLLIEQKQPEKAVPYLEKAISLNPSLPSPHTNLGSILLTKVSNASHTTEETARMVQEFQTAAELSLTAAQNAKPEYKAERTTQAGQAYFNLGYALSRVSRFADAVEAYKKSLELRPGDGKTYANMGLALHRQPTEDDDAAIAALKMGVAKNPQDADSWTLLGITQAHIVSPNGVQPTAKDAPGAINSLETALKIKPDNYEAQTTLALMYALVGRDADAAAAYSTAAAMGEASSKPGIKSGLANLYYNRGVTLSRQEKFVEATLAYEQALSINSTYYDALVGNGYALTRQGKFREASLDYERALSAKPNSYEALVGDGYALAKQKKWNAAIVQYRAAAHVAQTSKQQLLVWKNLSAAYDKTKDAKNLAYARHKVSLLEPAPPVTDAAGYLVYWNQKGLEYQDKSDFPAALRAFQTALKYQPGSAVVHNNIGVVYEKLFRLDLAVKEYKKALAIDPTMKIARDNLGRFAPSGLLTPKSNPLPKYAQPTNSRRR